MAVLGQVKYNLKATGVSAQVPNDPRARLMYYLNSLCSVLELDDDPNINRLRRYQNYFLSREDRDMLVQLCLLLKPDVLLNKCIFQNDSLCRDKANEFYELEQVQNSLLIVRNIMIGGQNRRVTKIMAFKMEWLNRNWTQPMTTLLETIRQEKLERERQERLARQRQMEARLRQEALEWDRMRSDRDSAACIIL